MLLMVLSLLKSLPMKPSSEFDDYVDPQDLPPEDPLISAFKPISIAPRPILPRKRFRVPMGDSKNDKSHYRNYILAPDLYAPPVCIVIGEANNNTDQCGAI